MLEDAARYSEVFAQADRLRLGADDAAIHDATETDADATNQTAKDDHVATHDSCRDSAKSEQTNTPLWKYYLDLGRAAGHLLLARTARWQRFCQKMNVPPYLLWEQLPGFDRLRRTLAEAEKTSFSTDEFSCWLNDPCSEGMPEITAFTADPSIGAAADMETFRQLVRQWGG